MIDDLVNTMTNDFGLKVTTPMQELLATAFAQNGDMDKYTLAWKKLSSKERKVSAKCHSAVLRGLLQNQQPELAAEVAKSMKALNYNVTPYLVTELYKVFVQ